MTMIHERDFLPEDPSRQHGRFMADPVLAQRLKRIFAERLPENASLLDLSYSLTIANTATHVLSYGVAFLHDGEVRRLIATQKVYNAILEIGFVENVVHSLATQLALDIVEANPKLIAGSRIVPAVAVPQGPVPQEG